MLGAKHLARLVAYSVLVSMGILLATLGLQVDALTAPVMYYMIVSVLTAAAFFMLTGMTDRTRITDPSTDAGDVDTAASQPIYVAYGIKEPSVYRDDDDEVGIVHRIGQFGRHGGLGSSRGRRAGRHPSCR